MTNDFTPIKGDSYSWNRDREDGVRVVNHTEQDRITELLVGRRITKVDDEHLLLDNGTVIKAIGRDGGCSCSAGCYDLSVLNGVDNIITRVSFDYAPDDEYDYPEKPEKTPHPDNPEYGGYYRVFVFADNEQINLMQFDGSDGNGYYGTGYEILVREA